MAISVALNVTPVKRNVAANVNVAFAAAGRGLHCAVMHNSRFPNLPRALADSGRSQADLSRAMRVSRTTISRWMNGQGEPDTVEKLKELADYLHVSIAYLIGEDEATHNDEELRFLRKLREAPPNIRAAVEAVLDASKPKP